MTTPYRASFLPGTATAVVGAFVALVGADSDSDLVVALLGAIDRPEPWTTLAEIERGDQPLPPFALMAAEPDGLHVAFNGGVMVEVHRLGETVLRLGGNSGSGWRRELVPLATSCVFRLGNETTTGSRLWISRGVIPASVVTVDITPARSSDTENANGTDDQQNEREDGRTILRPGRQSASVPDSPLISSVPLVGSSPSPRNSSQVLAIRCDGGHLGPPNSSVCRVCHRLITDHRPFNVARPSLGTLRFSDGSNVLVSSPIVIGRTPPTAQLIDGEESVAIAIDSAELSRVHVVVHIADWSIQVSDQHSTNGTTVFLPGRPPQKLRPFEKVTIAAGTRIELGDAVSFVLTVADE